MYSVALLSVVELECKVNAILELIDKLALEFALNLEYDQFTEVMDLHGVTQGEYEYYFIVLTEYLEYVFYKQLNADLLQRVRNAHKFVRISRNELGMGSKYSRLACAHLL